MSLNLAATTQYNRWFRKRPDLIERYCSHGTGWNPGVYAYILKEHQAREDTWRYEAREWLAHPEKVFLERGHEYAASIINALLGGEPYEFNGNVPNAGLVGNLPQNACFEVPVWASRKGLSPVHVGALPPQCAALTTSWPSVRRWL